MKAGQSLDQGGLPGSVFADEGGNLPLEEAEVGSLEGLYCSESLVDTAKLQNRYGIVGGNRAAAQVDAMRVRVVHAAYSFVMNRFIMNLITT
jgi:hypothetical protein